MKIRVPIGATRVATVSRRLQIAAAILLVAVHFPSQAQKMNSKTSGSSTDERCVSNLKQIHAMIKLYLHHSGGGLGFPTSLESINLMTRDKSRFVCPADPVNTVRKNNSFKTSYEVVNDPLKPDLKNTPPERVAIVAEKSANHAGKRFVLFYDGSVKAFDEAQFAKLKNNSFVLDR